MTRFRVLLLAAIVACASGARAQVGPTPTWGIAYPDLYYSVGGVRMPQNVTGGGQGKGTINVSGGYYINGVPLVSSVASTAPPNQFANGQNASGLTYAQPFFVNIGGFLQGSQMPALSGDCTSAQGTTVLSCKTVNGQTPGTAAYKNTGTSVADPGTGSLEMLLPTQTITGPSYTYTAADMFKKTRRSNGGAAMSDTLPPASAMVNGSRLVIADVDTAAVTLTAGAGTSLVAPGTTTDVIGPGRDVSYDYDAPNATLRGAYNTRQVLLGPNNLSDLASAATARTNLGLGTAATQNTGTSGATVPLLNVANVWAAAQTYSVAPIFASLTGYLYCNGAGACTAATTIPASGLASGAAAGNVGTLGGDLVGNLPNPALAIVNTNTGSFGGASSVPVVTLDGKGRVTAASAVAVVAPAGTLSGTALNPSVVTSSLTALGTVNTGVWQASPVVNAYLANMAAGTIKGAASAGSPVDLTGAQATSLLTVVAGDTGSGGTKGLVPAPPAGSAAAAQFLAATGAFAVPQAAGPAGGDLTGNYPNPTVAPGAITNAKLAATMPTLTLKANITGATAGPTDTTFSPFLDAVFGTTQGTLLCRGSGGWTTISSASAASGYVLTYSGANACPSPQSPAAAAAAPRSSVRQTVQGGPQASGAPSFLPATSSNLNLTAQNISTGVNALTVAAAQGSNVTGQNDLVMQFTSNPTWSGLVGSQTVSGSSCTTSACTETTGAAHNLVVGATVTLSGCSSTFLNGIFQVASVPSSTTYTVNGPNPQTGTAFASATPTGCSYTVQNYLGINASSGATVSSLLVPIYQYGGTIPTTAGQFAFDINAMIGYVAGAATPLVYVGEATAGASTITASAAYDYNGYYDSGWTSTLPAASSITTRSSNLGITPQRRQFIAENINPDNGYAVGDELDNTTLYTVDSSSREPAALSVTRNSMSVITSSGGGFAAANKSGGQGTFLGTVNWKWKFVASRGWGGA